VAIVATAMSFLLLGGLVAADVKLSMSTITALAILLGLLHGFLNGSGMGHSGTAIIALLGLGLAVFVLVALAAASVVSLRTQWAHIAPYG